MVFGIKDNGVEPNGVLRIGCSTDPSCLVPNVTKLSRGAVGLPFHKCGYRVPHTGGVKWPSNRSCEILPKMQMAAHILDHRFRDLVLEAEGGNSAGSFAHVNDGGWPIPATCSLGAGLPEEVNLLANLQVEVLR